MKHFFFLLAFILLNSFVFSQNTVQQDSNKSKLLVIQDYRIEKLNNTYENNFHLNGYRIQIHSGNKRQPAKQSRLKFTQKYISIKAHESYNQPYYKVRVGDFKTKLEAVKFQKQLILLFPNCFIVKDKIEF